MFFYVYSDQSGYKLEEVLCIFNKVIKKNQLFCTDLVGVVVFTYTHTQEDMIVIDVKRCEPTAEPLHPAMNVIEE